MTTYPLIFGGVATALLRTLMGLWRSGDRDDESEEQDWQENLGQHGGAALAGYETQEEE